MPRVEREWHCAECGWRPWSAKVCQHVMPSRATSLEVGPVTDLMDDSALLCERVTVPRPADAPQRFVEKG